MELVLLGLTAIVTVLSIRIYGFLPFPTGVVAISLFSETFLAAYNAGYASYDMLGVFNFGGTSQNSLAVIAIYFGLSIAAMLSFWGTRSDNPGPVHKDVEPALAVEKMGVATSIIAVLVLGHFALFCLYANWSAVLDSGTYLASIYNLTMDPYDPLSIGPTVFKILPYMLIVTVLGLFFSFRQRLIGPSLIFGSIGFFYYLLLLGAHSRASSFGPFVLAALAYILKSRRYLLTTLVSLALGFISMAMALVGRGGTVHGLAALPEDFWNLFDGHANPINLGGDLAQGAFVLAETLQLNPDFETSYKFLSFSPLPSFIDGFSSILDQDQVRLHDYVPMGGIGELYHFGTFYSGLAALIVLIAVRLNVKVSKASQLSFLLGNLLLAAGMYVGFSYPVRTAMRFVWLSAIVSLLGAISPEEVASSRATSKWQRNWRTRSRKCE